MQTGTLLKGYGYWETTRYPVGGCFRRAVEDTPISDIQPMDRPYLGCTHTARMGKETIALSRDEFRAD